MARNYAALYYEYQDEMDALTDEEFGRLMRALISYSRDGTEIPADGNLKFYAKRVMNREDETKRNYNEIAEKNRRNIRKRWDAKKQKAEGDTKRYDSIPNDTTVYDSIPNNTARYQKYDSKSKSKSESESESQSQSQSQSESKSDEMRARDDAIALAPAAENLDAGLLGAFEAFWHLYPRKMGKDAARAEWLKIKPTYETQVRITNAVREQSKSRQWNKDGGRFIPAPAKWLSEGRWEDDVGGSTTIQDVMDQMEDW